MIPGDINFIGATSTNNGLTARIGNSECLHPAGTITVTYNGSVGEAFYQSEPFWASDDVNVLYPKFMMTKQSALFFLTPLIKKGKGYGYSFKWTKEKMEQDRIVLPVNNKGEIDFTYIEERVRELEEERVRELEAYLQEAGFEDCTLTKDEENALRNIKRGMISSKLIQIDELFDIATGRDIIIGRTQKGVIPLISHQHDNNGISKRIERIANRRLFNHETTLPLADRGVFLATTQSEDFHIGTRVKALTFKNGKQNENVRLFFVTSINKLQILFLDYLTNATDNLPNLKISVPVKKDGAIDYSFMETYISAIKKQCIARLKQEIDIERKAYNKVLDTQNQESHCTKTTMMELPIIEEQEIVEAAEDYECYQLKDDNQKIIDYIGDNKTILLGCYKNKKHLKWIQEQRIYNIRLGKRKGSMSNELELFGKTTLLILYDVYHPNKQIVYKIESCCEMSGQQLKGLGYPNQNAGKTYMTFKLSTHAIHTDHLKELRLIEKIINDHPNHTKGTPVFVEPKKTI